MHTNSRGVPVSLGSSLDRIRAAKAALATPDTTQPSLTRLAAVDIAAEVDAEFKQMRREIRHESIMRDLEALDAGSFEFTFDDVQQAQAFGNLTAPGASDEDFAKGWALFIDAALAGRARVTPAKAAA